MENKTDVIPMPKGPEAPKAAEPMKPARILIELNADGIKVSGDINDTVQAAGMLTRALWYVQKRVDDQIARDNMQKLILKGMAGGSGLPLVPPFKA